ncbi:hypothetical protein GUITHDRAFT_157080 [Guillardia theta CCMP2712]|uniref:AAA+ ATPase domain-containing protein n=1 Tax=Guillardia theta (strain CCMP2712) TaxID=905079 RepID=L1JWL7_GUITC|nr:hypothetical protein GUITHDRAFT_157080 [Guillardia theta CCMP2712]EKX52600.1 hypothetical protein GUITHDRAFT_157080 [Guillardia theta CCMP2712]|eukprot:XP_005839580.1 hypothetical protein GUITHDRAFT_157080 [Guillardia theta CCMP2712]
MVKLHTEAKDNVKFLSTLERHFKMLSMAPLVNITESLPSLFNGLRMVWVLSRHYNTDERMSTLMARIANEISNRVTNEIDVEQMFTSLSPSQVSAKLTEARHLMQGWYEVYMKTRDKIEKSGQEPEEDMKQGKLSDKNTRMSDRWEFDRQLLFGKTKYIEGILQDLQLVSDTIDQFIVFFGPQLKKVIGDSQSIDKMLERVNAMLTPYLHVEFEIFDPAHKARWDTLTKNFSAEVQDIEDETSKLINSSFAELRSTEGALQLLLHFKSIRSRKAITAVVEDKLSEILVQFSREVTQVHETFKANCDHPPVPKNQPPVSGAIMWSKGLFIRVKKTMLQFQSYCQMTESEQGNATIRQYIDLGKTLRNYENELHSNWKAKSEAEANELLRCLILRKDEDGEMQVNFPNELLTLMREAKCLDKMGYSVGETVMNIALREAKYLQLVQNLKQMIANYQHALSSLDPSLRELCAHNAESLKSGMSLGFTALNWISLGINDFIDKTNKKISIFVTFARAIDKNAATIADIVSEIQRGKLIPSTEALFGEETEGLDLQEVFSRLENHRSEVVNHLVSQHAQITPLLCKIEEVAVGTNTGRSSGMTSYYRYWEKRIYDAIVHLVLDGVADFASYLGMTAGKEGVRPLIRATARATPQIVYTPSMLDIQKMITKILKVILETTARSFIRWMDGTCLPCPSQIVHGHDEPVVFSFYDDVQAHPHCVKAILSMQTRVTKTGLSLEKASSRYARYMSLWNEERHSIVEKFIKTKSRTSIEFDERIKHYNNVMRDLGFFPPSVTVDFLHVNMTAAHSDIRNEAQAWITIIGKFLFDDANSKLNTVLEKISNIRYDLATAPDTLDNFKHLLQVIQETTESSTEIEAVCIDLQEKFDILNFYRIQVDAKSSQEALEIKGKWLDVVREARQKSHEVSKIKKQFAFTTNQECETFIGECDAFLKRLNEEGPAAPDIDLDYAVDLASAYAVEMKEMTKRKEGISMAMKLFGLEAATFTSLAKATELLACLQEIVSVYSDFRESCRNWSGALFFQELDIEALNSGVAAYLVKHRKISKNAQRLQLYEKLGSAIVAFQKSLPLISELKSEAMRPRHWKKLLPSIEINPNTFTLQELFALNLSEQAERVTEIVTEAQKEVAIEKGLEEIETNWKSQGLDLFKYERDGQDRGYCLKGTDEITLLLDDNLMNIASMSASKFCGPFIDQIRLWEKRLSLIGETLEAWLIVQRKWQYLEGIFVGSDDIRMQLPEAAKRFEKIDQAWSKIMQETHKERNVVKACCVDGRLELLRQLANDLDWCQKSLSDFLDSKRNSFPRFFFISDDEMLSVLGSSDVTAIQEHCLKIFDNCASLIFARQNKVVVGMISSEGENLNFRTAVATEGAVENWMTNVLAEMRASLHSIMKEGIFNYPKTSRLRWIEENLGMTVNGGSQLWWTWQVEDGFRKVKQGEKHAIKVLNQLLTKQLNDLVAEMRKDLSKQQRKKVNTLVIIDVHARDIIDGFVRDSILDEREFAWESQLRYYWVRADDELFVRQCTFSTPFGYEYMGLNGRLVITPLTDRCYMTLTQALSFRLGGAPAGPAGTGKTETVKDLAKAISLYCVVFNCGDGLDYKAMGSIFSGLVQCGAWGCFDEFNRIEAPVLSVVSAQLKTIQTAMIANAKMFHFEGREISLDDSCGFFITMNPGYAGRTELPDNLKALFRPMTMIVPDLNIICENMLLSEGFDLARILAKKMVTLYALAKEQLSRQYHYDWGLRALKSVLVMAGSLKRGSPDLPEDVVLMRALRDMNSPKFVFEDVPLFLGLLADLFPGLDCPRVGYPEFNAAVVGVIRKEKYIEISWQVDKVVQLYETMLTRHTTMIVGPTGGGKSVVLNTLCHAQTNLGRTTKLTVINPKAIPLSELYGVMDPVTRDWTDGLLSNIFREMNKPLPEGKDERRYICYDGDVDALWVENMNSVMDDNKLLTLPNGERIRLQPFASMLFEVGDLQYASPATVSRCGMVWVDPKNLGFDPYFKRWLGSVESPERAKTLDQLYSKYVPQLNEWVMLGLIFGEYEPRPKLVLPLTNLNLVVALCFMLSALLQEAEDPEAKELEAIFVACLTWSLGSALHEDSRKRFDAHLKKLSGMSGSDQPSVSISSLPGASKSTVFDYMYDPKMRGWSSWSSLVQEFSPAPGQAFYQILIPTADTVRSTWLVDTCVKISRPSIFVGESGTSKTVTLQHYLKNLSPETNNLLNISFSSRTSGKDLQVSIESNIEKRLKGTFGPPAGKKLIIFIDDVNMPLVDTYGTQQPVTLLKLFIEKQGLYDREELVWKHVIDTHCLAACGPPGGARNPMDPRFVSLFTVFNISFPSDESIIRIFSTILDNHFQPFSASKDGEFFKTCGKTFSESTLKLYKTVVANMPPTPTRFHYVFNLRDLSRICEGLCTATTDAILDGVGICRLWRNECLRVFHDRLISQEDKDWFIEQLKQTMKQQLQNYMDGAMAGEVIFGDFRNALRVIDGEAEARVNEDLGSYDNVKTIFDELLERYNETNKVMDLVLFDDALDHLCRLHRLLRLPRGNALLVGVGGSGKQSLTRLAAYAAQCKIFQITLTRTYGEEEFREDLRTMYSMLKTEAVVFLFTDQHVADESFLELINNLLTMGMVPALYAEDEREGIINSMRREVKEKGLPDSKDSCWNYFVESSRDNLHIVLAMSPVGEDLRRRCRNFPGMINNAVIDWFQPWPSEALQSVANRFLAQVELPEESRQNVTLHMMAVHHSVLEASSEFETQLRRHNYVTPKNYLNFINAYKHQLAESRSRNTEMVTRLDGGLKKLIQAAADVAVMKEELAKQTVVVEQKTRDCSELLQTISVNTKEATEKQAIAGEQEEILGVQSVEIAQQKATAEEKLGAALPALEEAAQALNDLDKKDIDEIKSFAKPHVLVQGVAECVAILKKVPDTSWKGAKAMMSDGRFLRSLLEFDKDSMTDKQISQVQKYMKDPKFNPTELKNISTAGAGLLKWVYAMVNYYNVAKEINPMRNAVRKAETELAKAQKDLSKVKNELADLSQTLEGLRDDLEKATIEKERLKEAADTMARQLAAAEKLINGLGSEQTRWKADMEDLNQKRINLVGDCLITSSFLSYLGAFSFDFRQRLITSKWQADQVDKKLPLSDPFSLQYLLTSDVEIIQWASEGLPSDDLSVQNGILCTRASSFPLCIDPQMQAVAWIKKREGKDLIGRIKTFNDGDFLKHLEMAVNFGFPFLFENLDEYIDPVVNPVLEKNITTNGNRKFVKLGDKEIDWDPSFRLYMTTKLSNPHYTPEVFGKASIINFTVTLEGLKEQLLNVVVGHERPDLEAQRLELVEEVSKNKATQKKLEDTLLRELASSSGNILDNAELISTLDSCKTSATEIGLKLEQARQTTEEIGVARSKYLTAAKRGSILFFSLSGLSSLNPMYETSLSSFLGVFVTALERSKKDSDLNARLANIIKTLTQQFYDYVCYGLFETHKLMFSFNMTVKILAGDENMDEKLLDFFLRGNTSLSEAAVQKPFSWIPQQGWKDLLQLTTLRPKFASMVNLVTKNEQTWKTWYDLEDPENHNIDMLDKEDLNGFEKSCIVKCFRADRIQNCVQKFVIENLGEGYVQPPVLNYKQVLAQSSPKTPVVFVLSPGADPAYSIFELAETEGMAPPKLKYVSLGQGQGPIAANLLETGANRGFWVLLQNCHLLPKWLKTLEKILEKLFEKPHKDFRLWLTTDPTDAFPLGILQQSFKVVTEPPNGLKLNLRSTWSKITEDSLASCPNPAFRPLIYVLAFLHAVVQERRKFGKLGWNVPYDFNESDFRVCFSLLNTYLTKQIENGDEQIPWNTLRYLVGEVHYGGRVTDSYDRRILTTYMQEFFGDFLFDITQKFFFYQDSKVQYGMPDSDSDRDQYAAFIEALPLLSGPEVFGLHSNAEIDYLNKASANILSNLIELQPRTSAGSEGATREEVVGAVANDIVSKIPELFDMPKLRKTLPSPSPTQVVLLQELDHWNRLLRTMSSSLKTLLRALSGEVGMSSTLEELSTALFNGVLPGSWSKLTPQTEKSLGEWVEMFLRRQDQYAEWAAEGQDPLVMWLSGLHIPATYLAAVVQTTCRMKKWALDKSTLYTKVTQMMSPTEVGSRLEFGCYVQGLYLQGASWDLKESRLVRQLPKTLVQPLPILQVIPVEAHRVKLQGMLKTPVYVTSLRRNAMGVGLVFEANLDTNHHVSHWILQGVALTLE